MRRAADAPAANGPTRAAATRGAAPGLEIAAGVNQAVDYLHERRGPSSSELLDLNWAYPTWDKVMESGLASVGASRTTASHARETLPVDKAYVVIAGEDPRPLLVVRECDSCGGTDDALLNRTENNERTMLLARWFRCVKLAPDVLEDSHPFRALFSKDDPPHLFVARSDGSGRVELDGSQSPRQLWKAMESVLREGYEKRPDSAVKALTKLLDQLDENDERVEFLRERWELLVEDDGPDARKTKKVAEDLEQAQAKREELLAKAVQVSDLGLIPVVEESESTSPR